MPSVQPELRLPQQASQARLHPYRCLKYGSKGKHMLLLQITSSLANPLPVCCRAEASVELALAYSHITDQRKRL